MNFSGSNICKEVHQDDIRVGMLFTVIEGRKYHDTGLASVNVTTQQMDRDGMGDVCRVTAVAFPYITYKTISKSIRNCGLDLRETRIALLPRAYARSRLREMSRNRRAKK